MTLMILSHFGGLYSGSFFLPSGSFLATFLAFSGSFVAFRLFLQYIYTGIYKIFSFL